MFMAIYVFFKNPIYIFRGIFLFISYLYYAWLLLKDFSLSIGEFFLLVSLSIYWLEVFYLI